MEVPRHLNKKDIEAERKEAQNQVAYWENTLKLAQEKLEYWKRLEDSISIVQARYIFD